MARLGAPPRRPPPVSTGPGVVDDHTARLAAAARGAPPTGCTGRADGAVRRTDTECLNGGSRPTDVTGRVAFIPGGGLTARRSGPSAPPGHAPFPRPPPD